jgi:hypothetical protein
VSAGPLRKPPLEWGLKLILSPQNHRCTPSDLDSFVANAKNTQQTLDTEINSGCGLSIQSYKEYLAEALQGFDGANNNNILVRMSAALGQANYEALERERQKYQTP